MTEHLELEVQTLLARFKGRRLVVGIDGLSRAGKTTLTGALAQSLVRLQHSVCVFHMDDHIVERNKRYDTGFAQWREYYEHQWDVENLRVNLFAKLRDHDELILPFYDGVRDRRVFRSVKVPKYCLVIIEGVFLQRPEWRIYFDYVFYVDCPRRERFFREREGARRQLAKFKTRYWPAEDHYLREVQPLVRADRVIRG